MTSETSTKDCLGWAARDPSGVLSPYSFGRRCLYWVFWLFLYHHSLFLFISNLSLLCAILYFFLGQATKLSIICRPCHFICWVCIYAGHSQFLLLLLWLPATFVLYNYLSTTRLHHGTWTANEQWFFKISIALWPWS